MSKPFFWVDWYVPSERNKFWVDWCVPNEQKKFSESTNKFPVSKQFFLSRLMRSQWAKKFLWVHWCVPSEQTIYSEPIDAIPVSPCKFIAIMQIRLESISTESLIFLNNNLGASIHGPCLNKWRKRNGISQATSEQLPLAKMWTAGLIDCNTSSTEIKILSFALYVLQMKLRKTINKRLTSFLYNCLHHHHHHLAPFMVETRQDE